MWLVSRPEQLLEYPCLRNSTWQVTTFPINDAFADQPLTPAAISKAPKGKHVKVDIQFTTYNARTIADKESGTQRQKWRDMLDSSTVESARAEHLRRQFA